MLCVPHVTCFRQHSASIWAMGTLEHNRCGAATVLVLHCVTLDTLHLLQNGLFIASAHLKKENMSYRYISHETAHARMIYAQKMIYHIAHSISSSCSCSSSSSWSTSIPDTLQSFLHLKELILSHWKPLQNSGLSCFMFSHC